MTGTESEPRGKSFWTDEELAKARRWHIQRLIKAGWTWIAPYLVKGTGRKKVESRPPEYITGRDGTLQFNPLTDAFAVRMGGTYISPNRYRWRGIVIDRHGSACEPDECPECHSTREQDNRFFMRTESRNPFAKPWEKAWTYCRTCISPAEIEELKNKALGAPPPMKPKQDRRYWTDRY